MHKSTERSKRFFRNPALEVDKPTHLETMPLEEKLEGKLIEKETSLANATQGSNRPMFVLVISMCLISLVVLLLTLLMLFGKIGNGCSCSTDEASSSSTKSLPTDSAKIKILEENITSLQLGLMEHLMQFNNTVIKTEAGYNALRDDLNMTRSELLLIPDNITITSRLENLGADLTGLKSAWNRTIIDLAELKSIQTKEKVIYHQTMTPSWLLAHASYINSKRSSTTEQLTFNAGSVHYAALLKVPMISANVLQTSTILTVRIVVSNDVAIGTNENSDNFYGLSDGISFVGFFARDKWHYLDTAPCFGHEGSSGATLTGVNIIFNHSFPRPSDSFYPGQLVMTFKLSARESWGSCYTAHDGGFVRTGGYNIRLNPRKGLTLEVYKDQKTSRVGIKFIEVTAVDDL